MTTDDRIAELEHRLGIVEDELAIRRLQHAYGYYLDKCYYDEVVDLFAEDGEVIFIGGVYKGRAGAARLYTGRFRSRFADGHNGPQFGRLLEHPMLQDFISVAPDRRTALGRYRTLMQAGTHQLAAGEARYALRNDHMCGRVVAAQRKPEAEQEDRKHEEIRRDAEQRQEHAENDHLDDEHRLAAEAVGKTAERHRADQNAEQARGADNAVLGFANVELGRD